MSDAGFREPIDGLKEQTDIVRIIGLEVTLDGLQRRGREVQLHREALKQPIEWNREEADYLVSMNGKEALRGMCMDHITRPDASDDPPRRACTRSLNSGMLLQPDDKRVVMCPHCGWEMDE
jgi:hypothetical protein